MLKYPWNDYSGRLSSLKLAVFGLLLVPAGSVAFAFATHTLGPRELNEAIHRIGLWGIRLIFIALAGALRNATERATPLAPGLIRNEYGALHWDERASSRKVVALSGHHSTPKADPASNSPAGAPAASQGPSCRRRRLTRSPRRAWMREMLDK